MFSCLSILGKSVLIVALAAGLLSQFFPCCAFAIRSFSKVSATPGSHILPSWMLFVNTDFFFFLEES